MLEGFDSGDEGHSNSWDEEGGDVTLWALIPACGGVCRIDSGGCRFFNKAAITASTTCWLGVQTCGAGPWGKIGDSDSSNAFHESSKSRERASAMGFDGPER